LHRQSAVEFLEYIGFTVANGLSIAGGANWSIEERFYPGVCTATTAVFVIALLWQRYSHSRLT
jgi:hypothetical protein